MEKNNLSLRQKKILRLQEQQRKLRGLNVQKQICDGTIINVRRIVDRRLQVKPKEVLGIIRKSIPLRKRKILRLREDVSKLKKSIPRKLNKRRLFYNG